MSVSEQLAENRRLQQSLQAQHQERAGKFQAYANPLYKQCDDKLRREEFAPFVALERAKRKLEQSQSETVKKLRAAEAEGLRLLDLLAASPPEVPAPSVPLDASAEEPETDAPPIPEFDL